MSLWNDDRVSIEPAPVKVGDTVNIKYHGILKNSGAQSVYLHYGVDGWKNTQTVKMDQINDGVFATAVKADAAHEVNFCFKDCANHWDNNTGWNWKTDVI